MYNNEVISDLIKTLSSTQPNGLLLYLSDHGEEVYDTKGLDFRGRNETKPTQAMYTIPFMIWQSPLWKKQHRIDLTNTVNRPYSSSNLIHTWADLIGLHFDEFDARKSIVNNDFKEYVRLIGDPYSAKPLIDFNQLVPKLETVKH